MSHEYKYRCTRCGKRLKYEYRDGLCRSCATPTWICNECGREYKYYTEIGLCRRCRSKDEIFRCDRCEEIFKTKKGLMQHERSHTEDFICPECGLRCGTEQAFGSHIAYHDPAKVEQKNEKMRDTCLERYGVTAPWASDQALEKAKKTKIERYGYYTYFQKPGVMRDVVRRAWTPEAREKRERTNIERYGGKTPMSSDDVLRRSRETCVRRYGYENPMLSPVVKAKAVETSIHRYGVLHPSQSKEMMDRVRQTQFDRFGGWAFHSERSFAGMRRTIAKQTGGYTDEQLDVVPSKDALSDFIRTFDHRPSIQEVAWSLGVSVKMVRLSLRKFDLEAFIDVDASISSANRTWKGILSAENLDFETEQYIYGDHRRCDFLVGGMVALEVNPVYTHASYGRKLFADRFGDRAIRPLYHRDKSVAALRNGYQPLCVWDWDDPHDIISIIRGVLDGTYETSQDYIPLDRPVIGVDVDDLDLDSVQPNIVWCDRYGEIVDDVSDDADENVRAGLYGVYDCGIAHLR